MEELNTITDIRMKEFDGWEYFDRISREASHSGVCRQKINHLQDPIHWIYSCSSLEKGLSWNPVLKS